jgi:ADP-ribose pyrophosphatase
MSHSDKPEGAKLGWSVLETRYPVTTPWLTLRQDRIHIADKGEITYTYIEASPAVFIVPVTSDGQVLLIRQYRYTVDTWCLEVPAGGTHDRAGVPLAEVAREELREEIGGVCEIIEHIAAFYGSDSKSDQECHVFLALDVTLTAPPEREGTEVIELCPLPIQEALVLARTGQIACGQSALALLLSEERLLRYGYVG